MKITNAVRRELDEIQQANGGLLVPRMVLARARDKKSALHEQFDWNVQRNAERGLLLQAQELIMQVKVRVETSSNEEISVRAYWSLGSNRVSGGGYRSLNSIMSNNDWRNELLATALNELESFRRRYERLEELATIFAALSQVQSTRSHTASRRSKTRRGLTGKAKTRQT